MGSGNVTISGSTVTINPSSNLGYSTGYNITMASGVITDIAGNAYAGISAVTDLNFVTTAAPDTTNPTLSAITPADDASNIAVDANLVLTFNESVNKGTGNIVIYKTSDNSVIETINVTSNQVTVSGNVVIINPSVTLANNTGHYIQIAATAFDDLSGNSYAGIANNSSFSFTTIAAADTANPTLSSAVPADNATGVTLNANITLTFNEAIAKGTGNITIRKTSDDSLVEAIDVTSAAVTVAGSTMIINPSVTLAGNTEYYAIIAATAVDDLAGNSYAGISSTTALSFTTQASDPS